MFTITNQTKRRIYLKLQKTAKSSTLVLTLYHIPSTQWPSLTTPRVDPGKQRKIPAIQDPSKVKVVDRIGLRWHIAFLAGNPHLVILEEIGMSQ